MVWLRGMVWLTLFVLSFVTPAQAGIQFLAPVSLHKQRELPARSQDVEALAAHSGRQEQDQDGFPLARE
jgi:hypothetical protein